MLEIARIACGIAMLVGGVFCACDKGENAPTRIGMALIAMCGAGYAWCA